MSRDEIVDTVYGAALALNRLKRGHDLVSSRDADTIETRIEQEWRITLALDDIVQIADEATRDRLVREVVSRYEWVGQATICGKDEMNWAMRLIRFSPCGSSKRRGVEADDSLAAILRPPTPA